MDMERLGERNRKVAAAVTAASQQLQITGDRVDFVGQIGTECQTGSGRLAVKLRFSSLR